MRESATARGYDEHWKRLRDWWLRIHPLCACDDCQEGKLRLHAAQVVDHIIPICTRPDLRLEPSNLRSMTKRCHDRHTAQQRLQGLV